MKKKLIRIKAYNSWVYIDKTLLNSKDPEKVYATMVKSNGYYTVSLCWSIGFNRIPSLRAADAYVKESFEGYCNS